MDFTISIPQPCPESWATMIPTSDGRHCAACQKTVVDFTLKTDAEILAYFKQAGAAVPCGRFRANQLARPLLPAVMASPAQRWRGWVAAALALWGLRAEAATVAPATRSPSATQPRRRVAPPAHTRQVAGRLVSGVVRDTDFREPLAQVQVRLNGTNRTATTDVNGYFRLWVPARRGPHSQRTLVVRRAGFATRVVRVPLAGRPARALQISLPIASHPNLSRHSLHTSGAPLMQYIKDVDEPSKESSQDSVAPTHSPGSAPNPPRRAWHQWLTRPFRRE